MPQARPDPGTHPLHAWLFTPQPVTGLAVFRVALGAILLSRWLPRWPHVQELYASGAFLAPWGYFPRLGLPHLAYPWAFTLFTVLIVSIVAVMVGYKTRFAAGLGAVLLMYFVPANTVFSCAVDRLSILSLAFMAFSPAGQALSLDRAVQRRPGRPAGPVYSPPWCQRMIALSFILLYVFAPMFKLGIDGWSYLNGETLGYAVRRWQFVTAASEYMGRQPLIRMVMAWGGIFGEWFIAVGLFVRALRPWAIACGILLHGLILFTVLIPPELSLIMMASYILFIEPQTWQRFSVQRRTARAACLESVQPAGSR